MERVTDARANDGDALDENGASDSASNVGSGVRVERVRLLVVEDDTGIAAMLSRGLRREGFEVELRQNGEGIARVVRLFEPHCVVLDLMLPGADGFQVLSEIRTVAAVPVIVLTARSQLGDRLRSFELGAADFIPKPYFFEEVVARIRARLPTAQGAASEETICFGAVVVDVAARTVRVEGAEVGFTRVEFDLLSHLLVRPRKLVSREHLSSCAVPDDDEEGGRSERTVDVHMSRIRRKLGESGARHIVTVRGLGYRFDPEEPGGEGRVRR